VRGIESSVAQKGNKGHKKKKTNRKIVIALQGLGSRLTMGGDEVSTIPCRERKGSEQGGVGRKRGERGGRRGSLTGKYGAKMVLATDKKREQNGRNHVRVFQEK